MKTHVITFLQLLPFAEKLAQAVQTMADLGVQRTSIKVFYVTEYSVQMQYYDGCIKEENPQPGKDGLTNILIWLTKTKTMR